MPSDEVLTPILTCEYVQKRGKSKIQRMKTDEEMLQDIHGAKESSLETESFKSSSSAEKGPWELGGANGAETHAKQPRLEG